MKIFIFLLSFALFFSCKNDKQEENIIPIQSKYNLDTNYNFGTLYTGVYHCKKLCTYSTLTYPTPDTTFFDTISVSVLIHPVKLNWIIIGPDTIPIDSSGAFTCNYHNYYCPFPYNDYSVIFRNDSIYLHSFLGGLGGGWFCNTTGKK